MRIFFVLLLSQTSCFVYAAASGFEQLRASYEQFFTSRYALEQEFPFRLISVRDRLVQITPSTDVMQPLIELTKEDFIAGEKVNALLTKSFLPLLFGITASEYRDALILSRQFVTSALQQLGDVSREKLQHLLQKIPDRKLSYTLFLAPYRKTDADLFYGSQKINMVRNGTVSLRSEDSSDAQRHISKEIDHYRALLFYNYNRKRQVPTPLAARLNFKLNDKEAVLRTDILINLFPHIMPFAKEEPPVSFRSFVVPEGNRFRFPAALISVHAPLDEGQQPQLHISFGNFATIKGLEFVFDDQRDHHYTPYLDGSLQKFSPLQMKFRFKKISLSLATLQADKVRTTFSMGFKLGTLRSADFGNFNIAKIDNKFKTAINQEIDAAKNKAISKTLSDDKIAKFIGDNTVQALQQLFSAKTTPATEETSL